MLPEDFLAPYAAHSAQGQGRRFAEAPHASRSQFQRDRDRIIHSSAFRRLEYKTQVFLNHEGDLFRTRLTHSLEVAQVGRSIARNLRLNEDLVEAIALAHDLGHTPFGHVGQDVLNECMQAHGGFEHNLQSLRVVDTLEEHYGAFDGLNLMFETREGILKHCSLTHARELGPVAQRFIDRTQPTLEAQLTNLADEIADIRLYQFEINQQRELISNPIAYVDNLLSTQPADQVTPQLRKTLLELVNTRSDLLDRLNRELSSLLNESITLQLNQKQLLSTAQSLRATLDEQMFWIPSNKPLDLEWLVSRMDASTLDLVLVEGFKHEAVPKILLFRQNSGHRVEELVIDEHTIAVASDVSIATSLPLLDLNDVPQIATFIVSWLAKQ